MKQSSVFEQRMQCLEGTFAVEGMKITSKTRQALRSLESGKADYRQLIEEAKKRYAPKR